jgi:membrane-associated protease RseP (regulator of RpoE activity)
LKWKIEKANPSNHAKKLPRRRNKEPLMRKTIAASTAFWLALFGLLLLASATLRAQDEGPANQRVEKRKMVIIDDDGNEKVLEGSGPSVKRGYLGVELTELTPELRSHFGAPDNAGVMVAHVQSGSPADKAGLKVGDIITGLDGKPIESSWNLRERVGKLDEGAVVPIEIRRDGRLQTLSAAVELRDRAEIDVAPLFMKRLGDEDHVYLRGPGALALPAGPGSPRRTPREAVLEKKLKELEKRLTELEARLPKN